MVLAEMIASGELSALAQPGAEPAARRPLQLTGHRARRRHRARPRGAARAARRHHQLHRRRRAEGAQAARDGDRRRCAPTSTRMLERGDVADGGEHRDVLEAYRMFAHDRGWVHKLRRGGDDRPHRRGRGRARAVRHPRPHAAPDRSLSARAAARPRRSRQPAAAPAARPGPRAVARAAAGERHPGRPLDGPGGAARLRPQAAARPGAGGRRPDLACRHRGARARHRGGRRDRERHRPRRSGRRHHRRRRDRRRACAPDARHRGGLCRARAAARAPAGAISARCATSRASPRTAQTVDAADQCRPAGRPAAYRGDRRRRHRPVPHRTAVHGGAARSRAPASSSRSIARCSMPPATSR